METLKNLINKKCFKLTFEHGFISIENSTLLNKIQTLNPYIIDWSNIPDYLYKEEFFNLAEKMGGKETIHFMHLMNWLDQVNGAFIMDYPDDGKKEILQTCLNGLKYNHDLMMHSKNSIYSSIWRENFIYGTTHDSTHQILCDQNKDYFLRYLFGDLKYQFELSIDHITYNVNTLRGAFTFNKNVNLKTSSI